MTVVAEIVGNNDGGDIIGSDEFRRNSHVTCRQGQPYHWSGGKWRRVSMDVEGIEKFVRLFVA